MFGGRSTPARFQGCPPEGGRKSQGQFVGCWAQGRRVLLQLMFVAAVRMDWVLWLRLLLLVVCLNKVQQMRMS